MCNNPAYRAVSYDELAAAYQQQMEVLLEEGVDTLLIETIFDSLNAKAAIYAAEQAMKRTGSRSTFDAFGYRIGYRRTYTFGANARCIPRICAACTDLFYRIELFVWCASVEAFPPTTGLLVHLII